MGYPVVQESASARYQSEELNLATVTVLRLLNFPVHGCEPEKRVLGKIDPAGSSKITGCGKRMRRRHE
jgi:hypothetical protein